MILSNNKRITTEALKALHNDVFQWALFCADFDKEIAREVVQSTYLKVLEGKAVFKGNSSLKTWLLGVARLTHLEVRKRSATDNSRSEHTELDPVEANDSRQEQPLSTIPKFEIAQAINALSLMQREIIYLHFYKELTLSEIAQTLNTTTGTISSQYNRAKVKLGIALTDWRPICETI